MDSNSTSHISHAKSLQLMQRRPGFHLTLMTLATLSDIRARLGSKPALNSSTSFASDQPLLSVHRPCRESRRRAGMGNRATRSSCHCPQSSPKAAIVFSRKYGAIQRVKCNAYVDSSARSPQQPCCGSLAVLCGVHLLAGICTYISKPAYTSTGLLCRHLTCSAAS